MHKKILAVALSGMLVFGTGISTHAAESKEEGLGSLLGGLMDSLGSEEGDIDDLLSSLGGEEGGLDDLLSSLGGEGGLDELLSSLGGEDVGALLAGLGSEEGLLGSVLGGLSGDETEGLSKEDLLGLGEALSDPDISSLFAADGFGTVILDMLGSEDTALGSFISSMKGEDGSYDIERIIKSLEEAEEKEDSFVIDGTEIPAEEIRESVTGIMALFGLSEETEAA